MMRTLTRLILIAAIGGSLMGCSSMSDEGVGTVGGTIAGGAIGGALSHGSVAGVIGGALIGGFVGNQVGQSMDESNYYYDNGGY